MKNIIVASILVLFAATPLCAQSVYFDAGIGVGAPTTTIDGDDVSDYLSGEGITEVGVDVSLKLGAGPLAGTPLYIAGVLEGIGHRFDDGVNYIQYNSYLIGPSLIIYPVPALQLSGSVGFSMVANDTDIPGYTPYESESGYAYDLSAAIELGQTNHGLLLGVKYFQAVNTLETSGAEQDSSLFSVFVKYVYRQKPKAPRAAW